MEHDQQKRAPVLRPRVKPKGMLGRIMRWFRDYDMRLGFAAIALL